MKSLYRHIRNQHEHNHLCETCGKTFARENHKCVVKQKIKKNKEETLKKVEETEEWNPSDHEVKK